MSELTDLQEFLKSDLPVLEFNNAGFPTSASQNRQERWLNLAAVNLRGFGKQPCVVRRCTKHNDVQTEVRRWSEENFLLIKSKDESYGALFMGEDACLYQSVLDGQRVLRHDPGDEIVEDIYIYNKIDNPLGIQLESVRCRVIDVLYEIGYLNWPCLNTAERLALVSHKSGSAEAKQALDSLYDGDQTSTLEMFLGHTSNEKIRQEIWEAGKRGKFRLNTKAMLWLLKRPDWNTNSCVTFMALGIAAEHPQETSKLMLHPNNLVRLHLADLIDNTEVLLEWLGWENNPAVRRRILLSLQRATSPAALVAKIKSTINAKSVATKSEKAQNNLEIIGWVLANWRQGFIDESIKTALQEAENLPIGENNQKKIKDLIKQYAFIKS